MISMTNVAPMSVKRWRQRFSTTSAMSSPKPINVIVHPEATRSIASATSVSHADRRPANWRRIAESTWLTARATASDDAATTVSTSNTPAASSHAVPLVPR